MTEKDILNKESIRITKENKCYEKMFDWYLVD